jgi:hypothetical protein
LTTIQTIPKGVFLTIILSGKKNNGRGMERDKDIPVKIFSRGMEIIRFDVELFHLFSCSLKVLFIKKNLIIYLFTDISYYCVGLPCACR